MTKFLRSILINLSFIFIIGNVAAQEIDGIAAVLEEHVILKSLVEGQYQQALSQETVMPVDAKCLILDQLLLEKLFLAEAERDSIYIAEEEIDKELNRRMEVFVNMFGSQDKLEEYYGKSIYDLKEEFRSDVRQQMLSERMKGNIFRGLSVSPKEVREFYDEIPLDSLPFFNSEVEIGQIVMYVKPTLKQKMEAQAKAEKIREEIINGSNFSFQALLYSDDPGSSDNGGDLGWVKRGSFVPDFEAVAFRLKPGEISEVVETEFGYHIIQLVKKEGNRINAKHVLISSTTDFTNLETIRTEITAVKNRLHEGTLTFQKAVSIYSEDDQTKYSGGLMTNKETGNTFFEMNKLEGQIAVELAGINPGDFSTVISYKSLRGKEGFRIIYLKSETPAHKASIDTDYSKIKAVAKQSKQAEALEKWIEEKSKTVFVRLNEDYTDCENLKKWK
tara:strand:- start:1119 stop:2456 length:1338 start_codon:yes stop_codon:yes gene_type:complete